MAQQARRAFGASACVISLIEDRKLIPLAGAGIPGKALRSRLADDLPLAKRVISRRRPVFVRRVPRLPDARPSTSRSRLGQFTSYAGTPLITEGRVIGILGIYWAREIGKLARHETGHLQVLGDSIAAALANQRLYERMQRRQDRLASQRKRRKRAEKTVNRLTEDLERCVAERTTELNDTVRRLEIEVARREQADEALRESERRLRLAMESAKEGLWDRHFPSNSVYRSPGFYTMLGYEDGGIPESFEAWAELLHPDDREMATRRANAIQAPGSDTFEAEYRFRSRDGQWRWIRSRGRVIERDADGRAVRAIGTHIDITDRKQVEAEVYRLNAELEHRVIERTTELRNANLQLQIELSRRQQIEQALRCSREDLARLSRDREHLLEEERARISSHLHDEIGQSLTFLLLQLARFEKRIHDTDPALADEMKEARECTQEMMARIRAVAKSLRPVAIEHDGLIPSLRSSLTEWERISGVACRLVIALGSVAVEEPLSTVVYRIVQEALTNMARHAGASECEVRLAAAEDQLLLSIGDNGRGASAAALEGHHSLGIIGMKHRASAVGGELQVENGAKAGVLVKAWFPLRVDNCRAKADLAPPCQV